MTKTFHNTTNGHLQTNDGNALYYRSWVPAVDSRGVILLVHGLAEHCSRYEHVATHLNDQGYTVIAFDLRGHGQSEGRRIYINHFDEYVQDLAFIFNEIKSEFSDLPLFLLAHSLGTTVTLNFLLKYTPNISGVVLTGTAIVAGADISPVLISLSGLIGKLFPRLPTIALDSNLVSRDINIVKAYQEDPLVYNGKIPARTGAEINRTFRYLQSNAHKISLPLLILHGGSDRLTNPAGSQLLFDQVSSTDKTIKFFDGLYHEIMNEPEHETVINLISSWINNHSP